MCLFLAHYFQLSNPRWLVFPAVFLITAKAKKGIELSIPLKEQALILFGWIIG
jgi:hypothetical protein